MTKVSRNEPCPCGSGKKYKKCCLADMPSPASEVTEQLAAAIAAQDFASLEEMQEFLDQQVMEHNDQQRDEFHGLSSEHVHHMLMLPLDEQELIGWQPELDEQTITQTPVMQITLHLLALLHEAPLKATAKGNLPAAAVKFIYAQAAEQFIDAGLSYNHNVVSKEDDFSSLNVVRLLLTDLGIIKFQKKHFSLTQRGKKLSIVQIYQTLFDYYTLSYNWAYEDGYNESRFLPQTTSYALWQLAQLQQQNKKFTTKGFAQHIIDSFPMAVEDFIDDKYQTPYERTINAYSLRMLHRFWNLFGLITIEKTSMLEPTPFIPSELFNHVFWIKQPK
ncbi:MAG: SEC-C domain-containing protein [Psychrobium sp.]|nr:SEC-C domain-containing protein [Psychrobium sp.]